MKDYNKVADKRGRKYQICINSSGGVELFLVFYLPSQFKFFSIKLNDSVLGDAAKGLLNFETFNYVDVTEQIMKGLDEGKSPSVLTYLFEDSQDITSIVLKEAGIKKSTL